LENYNITKPLPKGFRILIIESGSKKYLSFQPQQVGILLDESRAADFPKADILYQGHYLAPVSNENIIFILPYDLQYTQISAKKKKRFH
jgi:hypothetical protein